MHRTRLVCLIVLHLALFAQVAVAAGGAGGGGGLGSGGGSGPDLNAIFREGSELLAEGECKKAERKFRKVLKAVEQNPEANYLRGVALQCQDKHKAAARYLKKAARYDDELYAAYERLGISYLALGKAEEAQSQLARLADLRQRCGDACPTKLLRAHAKLASVIAGAGTDAIEPAEGEPHGLIVEPAEGESHGLLFDPKADPQSAYLGAVELINSERFEEAIEELRRLTSTIGPHADVLNYLGYAHRRLGAFARAQAYYEQALAIDPLHRGANEYLGEMWAELGRLDLARHRLATLDEACPFGCAEYEDLERIIESRVVAAQ